MFIELAELLRCPEPHAASQPLVVLPGRMEGRTVLDGTIGCPVCEKQFPITQGIARFGASPVVVEGALPAVDTIHTFLGVTTPGGVVTVLGQAAQCADALAGMLDGVHVVSVNAAVPCTAESVSEIQASSGLPLRDGVVRGIVVGGEHTAPMWLADASRVVGAGARVVVLREDIEVPGSSAVAVGHGVWVGIRDQAPSAFVHLRHSS